MKKAEGMKFNRRETLKLAAYGAVLLSSPLATGCSSIPRYRQVAVDDSVPLVLIRANVVDVIRGVVDYGRTVTIRNGLIESITQKTPQKPAACSVIDMEDQYLIPGLIDAHCHATLSSEAQFNLFGLLTTLRQIKNNYRKQLLQGVTTIRDMGALSKMLHRNLAMIESGLWIGPRVVYCNKFMNIHGGHPDIDPEELSIFAGIAVAFTGNASAWFKDIAELNSNLQQNLEKGASFIKLSLDNKSLLCGKDDIPTYSEEQLKFIFDFAQKNNLPVSGHIHTKFGFRRAMRYGINSMEHAVADALLTDAEIGEMAAKSIAVVPTMALAQMLAAEEAFEELPDRYRSEFIEGELAIRRDALASPPDGYIEPAIHKKNIEALQYYKKYGCFDLYPRGIFMANPELYFKILLYAPQNLLKMKQAGVLIGCGTDAGVPYVYHGTLWREMEMLRRIGFSDPEVLRCATINNAKILRMEDKIGTIDEGKYADIVVLAADPLKSVEVCRSPQMVIKGGADIFVQSSGGVIYGAS